MSSPPGGPRSVPSLRCERSALARSPPSVKVSVLPAPMLLVLLPVSRRVLMLRVPIVARAFVARLTFVVAIQSAGSALVS